MLQRTLLFILLTLPVLGLAQNPEDIIGKHIELIAERLESDTEVEALHENLMYYYENPIPLNQATEEELLQSQLITPLQIKNLEQYRKSYGQLLSVNELLFINGFDQTIVEAITPFITLEYQPKKKKYFPGFIKQDVFWRISRRFNPADSVNDYLGDLNKYVFRYKIKTSGGLSAAITGEKDIGEAFFKENNPYGFDFYSGYLCLKERGRFESIILGNYKLFVGQGLTLGQGFSMYKSSKATSNQNFGNKIRPSASTSAYGNFRGVTFKYSTARLSVTPFFSYNHLDATIDTLILEGNKVTQIRTLKTDDYHRTFKENQRSNVANEMVAGLNSEYMFNSWKLGLTSFYTHYDIPLSHRDKPYNQFRFSGDKNLNTGLYFQTFGTKSNFFGEISSGLNLETAWVCGLTLYPDSRNSVEIMARNYSRAYQNFNSNGFRESSNAENERGLYIGYQSLLHKDWTFNTWFDWFIFPWLTFQSDKPANGNEFMGMIQFHPDNNFRAEILYKHQNKPYSISTEDPLSESIRKEKQNIRLQFEFLAMPQLSIRYRVEYSNFSKKNIYQSNGFLIYQDIIYRAEKHPLSATLRYAFFDSEDYDNRFYTYEHDVLYSFSVPAYYKKGTRLYLNSRYKFTDFCSIWLKVARTAYIKKNSIGKNADDQPSNQTEVSAQIRFHF